MRLHIFAISCLPHFHDNFYSCPLRRRCVQQLAVGDGRVDLDMPPRELVRNDHNERRLGVFKDHNDSIALVAAEAKYHGWQE
jgi:hypothetical protein